MDTITDSHGYRTKKDKGFDVSTYDLSVKFIDTTLLFALMPPPHGGAPTWWVPVSTVMTFLSKWHNLVALYTRPDERSNHD